MTGQSAAHDDEIYTEAEAAALTIGNDGYKAPGHTAPLAMLPGASTVGICDHTFELQSMRNTIAALRAENQLLKAQAEESAEIISELRRLCAPMSPAVIVPPYVLTCGPLPGERE